MAEGEAVMEGFLCPLCMKDLGDVIQLQVSILLYSTARQNEKKAGKCQNIFSCA